MSFLYERWLDGGLLGYFACPKPQHLLTKEENATLTSNNKYIIKQFDPEELKTPADIAAFIEKTSLALVINCNGTEHFKSLLAAIHHQMSGVIASRIRELHETPPLELIESRLMKNHRLTLDYAEPTAQASSRPIKRSRRDQDTDAETNPDP